MLLSEHQYEAGKHCTVSYESVWRIRKAAAFAQCHVGRSQIVCDMTYWVIIRRKNEFCSGNLCNNTGHLVIIPPFC